MRILLSSHAFSPNIGGLEAVSLMLAKEFVRAGHEVTVVTQTPAGYEAGDFPFIIIRQPSPWVLCRWIRWADLVFHSNISLRTAWPLCFICRPWVVVHHGMIPKSGGIRGLKGRIKHFILRWATCIAVSAAVADSFDTPAVVIPNPYDTEIFRSLPGIRRDQDLVFVGRFVSDKGLPVLLQALVQLRERELRPSLTVVGDGSEKAAWCRLADDLKFLQQVRFVGIRQGNALAKLLNAHRIIAIPSLWNEPFGIVALEGVACGCVAVGSEGGGLKEAIGPTGLTFPNGDVAALAACLERMLTDSDLVTRCQKAAPDHLTQHRPGLIAGRYIEIFEAALRKARSRRHRAGDC